MADSGVDTSNEGSDNPLINPSTSNAMDTVEDMIICETFPEELMEEPSPHDYVSKLKCSNKSRHCRHKKFHNLNVCLLNQKLRLAVCTNDTVAAEKWIKSGANPNYEDERKRCPLHIAAARGNIEVMKTLLSNGAHPEPIDARGETPLDTLLKYVNVEMKDLYLLNIDEAIQKKREVQSLLDNLDSLKLK